MIRNSDKLQEDIRAITGDEKAKIIAVPWELIHFIGDTKKGVLLSQLIYLSDRGKRNDRYVYKTYDEMTEATGLSQDQIRTYYKEFQQLGFFEWTVKKANAFPTVHFKFDFGKFQESFQEFLRNRYQNNSGIVAGKSQESLTKNTNIDTDIDNTLSHIIKEEDNFGSNHTKEDYTDNNEQMNIRDVLIRAGFCEELSVPVPPSFEPSLDNQYWAVTNYPTKSVKLITQLFIDYFTEKPNVKKTIQGWQTEWRKWFNREKGGQGYDEEKLSTEREEIIEKTLSVVYQFGLESDEDLMSPERFYSVLCTEEINLSKETVNECLTELEDRGMIQRYFQDYLFTPKNGLKGDFSDRNAGIYHGWNMIDESLSDFVSENSPVTREDLRQRFPKYCQDSIDAWLKSGMSRDALALNDGQYWDGDLYPGWFIPTGCDPFTGEPFESETHQHSAGA